MVKIRTASELISGVDRPPKVSFGEVSVAPRGFNLDRRHFQSVESELKAKREYALGIALLIEKHPEAFPDGPRRLNADEIIYMDTLLENARRSEIRNDNGDISTTLFGTFLIVSGLALGYFLNFHRS